MLAYQVNQYVNKYSTSGARYFIVVVVIFLIECFAKSEFKQGILNLKRV